MSEYQKTEEEILTDSDQFWSNDELDADKVEAIKDPRARAHARAALQTRQIKEDGL